jgi:hypothetical protein
VDKADPRGMFHNGQRQLLLPQSGQEISHLLQKRQAELRQSRPYGWEVMLHPPPCADILLCGLHFFVLFRKTWLANNLLQTPT